MKRIHTHYENLKVSRDAPPEVLKAAYRALAQKYHPDRNPDDSEVGRIMKLVNASYDVLSDPVRRLRHDQWIAEEEAAFGQSQSVRENVVSQATERAQSSTERDAGVESASVLYVFAALFGFLPLAIWLISLAKPAGSGERDSGFASEKVVLRSEIEGKNADRQLTIAQTCKYLLPDGRIIYSNTQQKNARRVMCFDPMPRSDQNPRSVGEEAGSRER